MASSAELVHFYAPAKAQQKKEILTKFGVISD